MRGRNDTREEERNLTMRLDRGFRSSQAYLLRKWNYNDSVTGHQELYRRPFNRSGGPLGYWELDEERRRCIAYAPFQVPFCV
jgi:hypothetical protein